MDGWRIHPSACHGMKAGLYDSNDLILIQEELTKEQKER
jgi:hypothetical protein